MWRTGSQVPINVYDEHGKPVCQCQSEAHAQRIVEAVNAAELLPELTEEFRLLRVRTEELWRAMRQDPRFRSSQTSRIALIVSDQ